MSHNGKNGYHPHPGGQSAGAYGAFNDLGQLGELRIADYSDATGRYYLLIADSPPARAFASALGLSPSALPGLSGWLAIPYSRDIDGLLVDAVQVIGHFIYGRHDLRQLTLIDEEAEDDEEQEKQPA